MNRRVLARPIFVLTLFGSVTSSAQIGSSETSACNPKLAQMLVEQQVAESKSVGGRPKRVKILLRSADFLWTLDRDTARSYFVEAFNTAKDHFAEKGFERASPQTGKGGGSAWIYVPDLRSDVIRATAKRDRELAKKFTAEILAEFEKAGERQGLDKTREQDDMLNLAAEIVATDPEFARFLYRRLMQYPLTQTWVWTLFSASRANQSFSDSIYAEALRNYRNEKPSRLLYLSAYPFGASTVFGLSRSSFSLSSVASFVPNPSLQRAFLDTFFARVGSLTGDPEALNAPVEKNALPEAVYMTTAMSEIEPIVMERFPDMLQRFTVARAQANAALTAEMRKEIEDLEKDAARSGLTFEQSIKELEEADGKGTLTDYMIAQILFQRRIRTEEQYAAYEPWLTKIKDDKNRLDLTSYFWFIRSELAIREKRFTEAEKMAGKVPEVDHRAILLFQIAKIHLDSTNDANSGFETLNAVSKLARSAPNSVAKAQVLFSLVQFYERVNHSVALGGLGEAIGVANQLEEPDLLQNWIYRQIKGKDFGFMASISLPGNNLEGMFTELGKKDFEMALANARGFDDKYFRTIAVIAIAKNCITATAPVRRKPRN